MADNGQKIIDLDKKRMHAMAQKDIATLNALLSDDLVYTHSTARLDTKHSSTPGWRPTPDTGARSATRRRKASTSCGRRFGGRPIRLLWNGASRRCYGPTRNVANRRWERSVWVTCPTTAPPRPCCVAVAPSDCPRRQTTW